LLTNVKTTIKNGTANTKISANRVKSNMIA
jgi:hypothetical protein